MNESTDAARKEAAGCLSVVMPAYNEEQTIEEIINRVLMRPEVGELLIVRTIRACVSSIRRSTRARERR